MSPASVMRSYRLAIVWAIGWRYAAFAGLVYTIIKISSMGVGS